MIISEKVLTFWFEETSPAQWWATDADFDQEVRERFSALHHQAVRGELFPWRETSRGRLAEVIILDQFSRNIFRDQAQAYAHDGHALALAQEAVGRGADLSLTPIERSFFYLPYMHSESPVIHEVAVELFERNGLAEGLDFEYQHKAIIERFGRYPHRNAALGRISTTEELEFLKQPGSSF